MNLIDKAKSIKDGAEILIQWLGSGGEVVDQLKSQGRANTCLVCPENISSFGITELVAEAIRQQLELKNNLQIRVIGERNLHICKVCSCALKLKVHVPIERIKPLPEERDKFPAHCWLLRETKDDNSPPI